MKIVLFLVISTLILTCLLTFAQKADDENLSLVRVEENPSLIIYKDSKWDYKFQPYVNKTKYRVVDISVDTAKIYPIVRKTISPKYHNQLNSQNWRICTVSNSKGKIVAISFWFKNDSGLDIREFTTLSEQIKKDVIWQLTFNINPVTDLFYCSCSILGPKL